MSERYSIPELREAATRETPPLMLTDQAKLLALVEAVEAAGRHAEDCCRTDLDLGSQLRTHEILCDALDRFDFGETT